MKNYTSNQINYTKLLFQFGGRRCHECKQTMDDFLCPYCIRMTEVEREKEVDRKTEPVPLAQASMPDIGNDSVFTILSSYVEDPEEVKQMAQLLDALKRATVFSSQVRYKDVDKLHIRQYADILIKSYEDFLDFQEKTESVDYTNWHLRHLTLDFHDQFFDFYKFDEVSHGCHVYTYRNGFFYYRDGQGVDIVYNDKFIPAPVYKFPDCITHLIFSNKCNPMLTQLPENLTHLEFGRNFNNGEQPFPPAFRFPPRLVRLIFGEFFNQALPQLPDTVTELKFGLRSNNGDQSFDNDYKFPFDLTHLTISSKLKHHIPHLPAGLLHIIYMIDSEDSHDPEFNTDTDTLITLRGILPYSAADPMPPVTIVRLQLDLRRFSLRYRHGE